MPTLPFTSLHELELTHALERRREEGDLSTSALNQIIGAIDKDLTQAVLTRPPTTWPPTTWPSWTSSSPRRRMRRKRR